MDLLHKIEEAWGWVGLQPKEVLACNPFGNLIVRAASGDIWRICPESLSAEVVAESVDDFDQLRTSPEFVGDWEMTLLVQRAKAALGSPAEGRCYCLKVPAVLGGDYGAANLATIELHELISASGDMARQIADLPDGVTATLRVVD